MDYDNDINTLPRTMGGEEVESAQVQAIQESMDAVARIRQQLQKEQARESVSECEECGNDIPIERQKAVLGVRFCIECQTYLEKAKRMFNQNPSVE